MFGHSTKVAWQIWGFFGSRITWYKNFNRMMKNGKKKFIFLFTLSMVLNEPNQSVCEIFPHCDEISFTQISPPCKVSHVLGTYNEKFIFERSLFPTGGQLRLEVTSEGSLPSSRSRHESPLVG